MLSCPSTLADYPRWGPWDLGLTSRLHQDVVTSAKSVFRVASEDNVKTFGTWIAPEFREVLPPAIFFLVGFHMLSLTRSLMLMSSEDRKH